MNKEDFVTPEIAKLLKEKGYKVSDNSYKRVIRDGEEVTIVTIDPKYNNIYKDELLPHLYDVQKWLREQYGIFIEIYFTQESYEGEVIDMWGQYSFYTNDDGIWVLASDTDKSYENVINKCIKKALNYI